MRQPVVKFPAATRFDTVWAIAGQGAVTARRLLVRDAIQSGTLMQIGTVCVPANMEYFVSWREHHPREAEIRAFYEWMREQLAG